MPEYHDRKLPVSTVTFETRSPEVTVDVMVCDDCGAIVGHTSQHNAWHERVAEKQGPLA